MSKAIFESSSPSNSSSKDRLTSPEPFSALLTPANPSPILNPLPLLDPISVSLKPKRGYPNEEAPQTPRITTQASCQLGNIHSLTSTQPGPRSSLSNTQINTKIHPSPSLLDGPMEERHVSSQDQESIERPPFAPLFTLINTGEITSHPRQVHYIFSDDDASELLTPALLRSLALSESQTPSSTSLITSTDLESSRGRESQTTGTSGASSSSSATFRKDGGSARTSKGHGKPRKSAEGEKEERLVIVDVNATGDSIVSASSLSSKWQVIRAKIESAPTWDGAEQAPDAMLGNLMLKIEGVSVTDADTADTHAYAPSARETDAPLSEDDMHALLESFDQKMSVLRCVLSARSRLNSKDSATAAAAIGAVRPDPDTHANADTTADLNADTDVDADADAADATQCE